jgi:hypothetical protein
MRIVQVPWPSTLYYPINCHNRVTLRYRDIARHLSCCSCGEEAVCQQGAHVGNGHKTDCSRFIVLQIDIFYVFLCRLRRSLKRDWNIRTWNPDSSSSLRLEAKTPRSSIEERHQSDIWHAPASCNSEIIFCLLPAVKSAPALPLQAQGRVLTSTKKLHLLARNGISRLLLMLLLFRVLLLFWVGRLGCGGGNDLLVFGLLCRLHLLFLKTDFDQFVPFDHDRQISSF